MMNPYIQGILFMAASLTISAFIGLACWRRRERPGAVALFVFICGILIWSFGLGMNILPLGQDWETFWTAVAFLGTAIIPPAWLIFALQYSGKEHVVTPTTVAFIAAVPATSVALAFTGVIPPGDIVSGQAYGIFLGYVYLTIMASILLIVSMLFDAPAVYRQQIGLVLMGAFIPWVATLSPAAEAGTGLPFIIMLAVLSVFAGAFRFHLFGDMPVLKERLLNGLTDGILVLDPAYRIVEINRRGEEIIGKTAPSILNKPVAEIINRFPELIAGYNGDEEKTYIRSIKQSGGGLQHYELRIAPVTDRRSRTIGHSLIVRDISQLKQTEDALVSAHTKLSILSEITQHDIKNHLGVIRGYAGLLEDITPENSDERAYTERIISAAEMIDEQIAIARDYQNLGVKAPVWQGVEAVARQSARIVRFNNISLSIDLGRLEVYADPLFGKVFYNLFENAVRHGGGVTAIRIGFTPAGEGGILWIEDDGKGVDPDLKGKLFARNVGKNTGLGLFLIREILMITGIAIRETGKAGKGARFEIVVPAGSYRYAEAGSEQ
jgi:PAS domain S-box-containing protein